MKTFLKSMTASNFRAISGEITVPLDAPVVIVHAQNAVGKTSFMSAIELGLTGRLPGFERIDSHYLEHVAHKGSGTARVSLQASSEAVPSFVEIQGSTIKGKPILSDVDAQFFSERCYLGQATLSRLLELYAPGDSGVDSALSMFVRDLLGVDRLDALIDGLHMAGHVARIRHALPRFKQLEHELESIKDDLKTRKERVKLLRRQEHEERAAVLQLASSFGGDIEGRFLVDPKVRQALFRSEDDERDFSRITALRLQLASVYEAWRTMTASTSAVAAADDRAALAQKHLFEWEQTYGRFLNRLLGRLGAILTTLPNVEVVEPHDVHAMAVAMVQQELQRCRQELSNSSARRKRLSQLESLISGSGDRLVGIDAKLNELSDRAGSLSRVLSDLLPHVHSNDCPVCGRDYSEISAVPLRNRIAELATRLSGEAAILNSLSSERGEVAREIASLTTERERLAPLALDEVAEAALRQRLIDLTDISEQLDGLAVEAARGTELRREAAAADRALALSRKRDRQINATRLELANITEKLNQAAPSRSESVEAIFQRLKSNISAEESALQSRLSLRKELELQWSRLTELKNELGNRENAIARLDAARKEASEKLAASQTCRGIASQVSQAALKAKTAVVQRVFTESLNKTWRELFVRLAPDEQFIPRFVVPEVSGDLRISLETYHSAAGVAGPPQAMLSTGNLNTAALSLFLALNMSVEPRVPLLMLDDPVQSMDEVHTSQLAALLRIISRGSQRRQIVIAVHERSLFEYLAFELSPSAPGDTLLTIELDRRADGMTTVLPRYREFKIETAVA